MTDLLFTPIRLKELEVLIENSVERGIKAYKNKLTETESIEPDNPLSIKEVAKLTGLSVPTLYGYCQRREIPYHKTGNRLRFFKPQIITWIKSGRVKTVSEIEDDADAFLSLKK